jgi:hypothetical protein
MNCWLCSKKINNRESHLVFSNKKFCTVCTAWMILEREALPNDGSAKGALLAKEICNKKEK